MSPPRRAALLLALLLPLLALLPRRAEAQDTTRHLRRAPRAAWPTLLGDPYHRGVSALEGPRRGEIVWTADLGGGLLATPAVDERGRSYWPTLAGEIQILGPDGERLGRLELRQASHSSPVLSRAGDLYAADRSGTVYRFDPSGARRWQVEIGGELVSSPLLDEASGMLYISAADRTLGLRADTGAIVFALDMRNEHYNSSPTLGPDGLVRFSNWDGWFVAVQPTGERQILRRIFRRGKASTPTVDSFGVSFLAADSGEVMALSRRGLPIWSVRLGGPVLSFLALLPDGRLLVPVTGQGLQAIWPAGRLSWAWLEPGVRFTPTLAVDHLGQTYLSTSQGAVVALDPEGVARWALDTRLPLTSGPVLLPPSRGWPRALVGASDGSVVCVE